MQEERLATPAGTGSAPAQSHETACLRAPVERLMGAVTGPGPGPSLCMTEPRESLPQTGTFHHRAGEKVFQKKRKVYVVTIE